MTLEIMSDGVHKVLGIHFDINKYIQCVNFSRVNRNWTEKGLR